MVTRLHRNINSIQSSYCTYTSMLLWDSKPQILTGHDSKMGSPSGLPTECRRGWDVVRTHQSTSLAKQHDGWSLTDPSLLEPLGLYRELLPPGWQLPGRQYGGGCVKSVGGTRHAPTLFCVLKPLCGNPRQAHWFGLQIVYFQNSSHHLAWSLPGTPIPGKLGKC